MSEQEQLERLAIEVRAVREETREVDFVASTEAIDSHGTIVKSNWDLKRFIKNPVILYSHDNRSLPIGRGKNTKVVGKELHTTVKFASAKANPFAENVFQSVLEETVGGASVGFYPREVRWEKHNDEEVLVLDDNELREISVTPVPSNPEALAKLRMRATGRTDPAHNTSAPTAPERASERVAPSQENGMTAEEIAALKKQNEERGAELRVTTKQLEDVRTERKVLETQNAEIAKERDAFKDRAEKAEGELVERVVDGFVGVKITPAEKGEYLELARSNRPLFDRMMKQRSDLPTAIGKQVISDPKAEERKLPGSDAADEGQELIDEIDAALAKKGGA
jgi:HK97 family phage prohead protease